MRKKTFFLIGLLLLLLPSLARAGKTTVISTPATHVFDVMILDTQGNAVSRVITHSNNDTTIDWTLEISPVQSTQGRLFTKNSFGNWENSGRVLDLTPFFDSNQMPYYPPDDEADEGFSPWPEPFYAQYTVSVVPLPESKRYQSRVGPSSSYAGGGAYKTNKIEYCDALFIEGEYVYAEISYTTVGIRRLYFQKSVFESLYDVPQETLTPHKAVLLSNATARFGPGDKYDTFKEAKVSSGTTLSVFFEESGWVFAEFSCDKLGVVRGWFPADIVQAQ